VADIVAILIAAALAIVPYNFCTGRWSSEWTQTVRGISLMMLALFMPWFLVATGIGADQTLVPIAMLLLAGAFGAGYYQHWRRARSSR
jgi:Na+/proline symporter